MALLTLAATDISDGLGVSIGAFGVGVAIIRLGALGGVPVLRLADRLGPADAAASSRSRRSRC